MIINLRGTNGSGKTTLVRQLIGPEPQAVDLVGYFTKAKTPRRKYVEGYGQPGGFLAVGSYRQGCGGMDTIPSFQLQQEAIAKALVKWQERPQIAPKHVLCEGVLASTVYGSWADFFLRLKAQGHAVLVAYLDTPLEVCLERIRERQRATERGEREIKEDLVANKHKAIAATRAKFREAGIHTATLRHERAEQDLRDIMKGYNE